jgi:hypothetical protein
VSAASEKPTFAAYYDEFQGDAHFEALDMLSRQMSFKVDAVSGSLGKETRAALSQLEPLFDTDKLSDEDDQSTAPFDTTRFQQELHDLAHKMSACFGVDQPHLTRLIAFDKVVAAFDSSLHACRDARTCVELVSNDTITTIVTQCLIHLHCQSI